MSTHITGLICSKKRRDSSEVILGPSPLPFGHPGKWRCNSAKRSLLSQSTPRPPCLTAVRSTFDHRRWCAGGRPSSLSAAACIVAWVFVESPINLTTLLLMVRGNRCAVFPDCFSEWSLLPSCQEWRSDGGASGCLLALSLQDSHILAFRIRLQILHLAWNFLSILPFPTQSLGPRRTQLPSQSSQIEETHVHGACERQRADTYSRKNLPTQQRGNVFKKRTKFVCKVLCNVLKWAKQSVFLKCWLITQAPESHFIHQGPLILSNQRGL